MQRAPQVYPERPRERVEPPLGMVSPELPYPGKSAVRAPGLGLFLLVCWILSLAGLSAPGRSGPLTVGALDSIAVVKLATRGIAFVVLALILLRYIQTRRSRVLLQRLFPLMLFAGWTVASIYWSALRTVTIGHAGEVVLLVMLSTAAGFLSLEEADHKRICCHLTIITVLMSLLLIVLNFGQILAGDRPVGYMHPNDLAKTAGAGLMMLTCCHLLWRWQWTRRLLVPAAGILSFAIFAARSRTASTLTPLMLLLICWLLRKSRTLVVVCALCGLLAAVIAYNQTAEPLQDSVVAYMARGQRSDELVGLSGRTELWTIALQSFQASPIFGSGYYVMTETGFFDVWGKRQWQTAHNAFLHVLTGLGLVGLFFFLWGLVAAMRPSLVALKDLGRSRKAECLAAVMVIWYCAMGMFELSFFGPVDTAVVIFFVTLGISAGRPPAPGPDRLYQP